MKKLPSKLPKELTDKFQVENNTLKRAVKQNPKDRIELEIGDSKQPDFYPQAKIKRWDNEVNASFRYVDNEPGEPVIETEGKVIKYKKQKIEFHAYELDPADELEDGGLEIELLLKEKPDTNKFDFTIQTKELDFFYQPALTQQEIDEGASRAEDVEGSYAVYHKTKGGMNNSKGMEYKVGKAFHIYRPFAHDANGDGIYCDLSIDIPEEIPTRDGMVAPNGVLTVTIDQTWLDNAVYPVVVDPTFGYTVAGASGTGGNDDWFGTLFTSPADFGSLVSFSCYATRSTGTPSLKLVIVNTSLGILTNGISDATSFTGSNVLKTPTFGTLPTLSASTDYVFGGITTTIAGQIKYDTDAGVTGYSDTTNSYATPQDPTGASTNTNKYSIYATYIADSNASIIGDENFSEAAAQTNVDVSLTIPATTDFIVISFSSYWEGVGAGQIAASVTLDPAGTPESATFVTTKDTGGSDPNIAEMWYLRTSTTGSKTLRIAFAGGEEAVETVGVQVWYCKGVKASGNPVEDSDGDIATGAAPDTASVTLTHVSSSLAFAHGYSFDYNPTGTGGTETNDWDTGDNYAHTRQNNGAANTTFEVSGAAVAMVAAAFLEEPDASPSTITPTRMMRGLG